MATTIQKPLFWHQGLFLQPQHMQLSDLAVQSQLIPAQELILPHFWGVRDLEIKRAALGIRSFGIAKGRFLFPDGTYVECPGNADVEDRAFDDAWLRDGRPLEVYLGLKKWNRGGENVTVHTNGNGLADVSTRFVAAAEPEEAKDIHAGGPVGQVKRLTHVLKIFWGAERDHLGDYALIPLAQIDRLGAEFVLSPNYIPPCVSLSGSGVLQRLIQEIFDQLAARSRQLEEHKRQRGLHAADFGSRDMAYLLALRSINRYLPWLRHYLEASETHPWPVYGTLRQIVGELSSFSERISVLGEDPQEGSQPLPDYNPLDLYRGFAAAERLILRLLDEITAGPDHSVPLNPENGVWGADLKPALFEGRNRFFLAVTTAEEPSKVAEALRTVAKVSSKQHIELLISHALPGIPAEYLQTPPQELPRRKNVTYFALDSAGDSWAPVEREKAIAFCWDGAPTDLSVSLLAVERV